MRRVGSHETMNAVERVRGDPAAVAKPRRKLPIIDGAPSEGRFSKAALPTIIRDFLKQLLGVHDTPFLDVVLYRHLRLSGF